ncbi:hypothetical protein GCM10010885_08200 [Alicyclobacillus cellulosilyticus]|uniref:Uncharacterized protein n=1 Tax=Alicyclobacillus cellulosilyticus TaxID=1003997 RepID=A0A917K8A0_9BACL|nr:hypothetical protein [Alicyclobacillus cellulosilyticus]GGJ01360.1 hypothetical protein GCM10010885_08200 [Alicyclobacillus cellulosilyticus]
MITHQHVQRCVGKWVICHTRHGDVMGRVEACWPTHIVLAVPRRPVGLVDGVGQVRADAAVYAAATSHPAAALSAAVRPALAYWGWGPYGFARTAIPLAAIVGLTVIGASALWW